MFTELHLKVLLHSSHIFCGTKSVRTADVNQHGATKPLQVSVWVSTITVIQIGPHDFSMGWKGQFIKLFKQHPYTDQQTVQLQTTVYTIKNLTLHTLRATDTHKQVYCQLTVQIFELQKHSYMFRLRSVAILREQKYSKTYTALSCSLSIVNSKMYKININVNITVE